MSFDPIIEPLIRSPKLPIYIEELNAFYEEEKKKRQAFYDWLTEDVEAEFIEGEVVIHSPAKNNHIDYSGFLFQLLAAYVNKHKLGQIKHEKALVRLTRNDFEPGVCFFKKEKSEKFEEDTMFFPAPDLVIEVLSPSTEKYDRGVKFKDYALHGVQEYWMIDAKTKTIEQYFLEGDQYVLNVKVKDGNISSRVIDGFTIPVDAVFDEEKNLRALQSILTK